MIISFLGGWDEQALPYNSSDSHIVRFQLLFCFIPSREFSCHVANILIVLKILCLSYFLCPSLALADQWLCWSQCRVWELYSRSQLRQVESLSKGKCIHHFSLLTVKGRFSEIKDAKSRAYLLHLKTLSWLEVVCWNLGNYSQYQPTVLWLPSVLLIVFSYFQHQ